ncbi:MAG: sigma-70 family RNA polymerase sigma factor [Clostridia bacterium]|nr:sigma-70 family RNA polymerase sigma factor [Clostridia bacterium]
MYNCVLKGLIENFRMQDMAAFEIIFDEFKSRIYSYARKQKSEDLIGELTLFLIELIYYMDVDKFCSDKSDGLERYILVCLKNKYISICRKKVKEKDMLKEAYDTDLISLDSAETRIDICEALSNLTERQRDIIICKYIYCLSDFQIAEIFKISRQAVNRLKNRGLKVLKEYYSM